MNKDYSKENDTSSNRSSKTDTHTTLYPRKYLKSNREAARVWNILKKRLQALVVLILLWWQNYNSFLKTQTQVQLVFQARYLLLTLQQKWLGFHSFSASPFWYLQIKPNESVTRTTLSGINQGAPFRSTTATISRPILDISALWMLFYSLCFHFSHVLMIYLRKIVHGRKTPLNALIRLLHSCLLRRMSVALKLRKVYSRRFNALFQLLPEILWLDAE